MKLFYENANVKIFQGDASAVIRELPSESFDLVFTSPPYNLSDPQHSGRYPKGGMWEGQIANGYRSHGDNLPHWKYVQWQRGLLLDLWRLITPAGAIYYNHKPRPVKGNIRLPLEWWPLPLRQIVIWNRKCGINFSKSHYAPFHEWILIGAKPEFSLINRSVSALGDVWTIPCEQHSDHPAPFPIALPARAIETTGAKRIVDPFSGSGSTLIAAMRAGVHATGIEKDRTYCQMSADRCEAELRGGGVSSFLPRFIKAGPGRIVADGQPPTNSRQARRAIPPHPDHFPQRHPA